MVRSSSDKAHLQTHPDLLKEGITGADLSLPLFDGTSKDPKDHLIDIDTPSMETCADVRVYFHAIGEVFDERAGISRPEDHAARIIYDARVVRAGREYLKYCRDRHCGFWLSSDRDILAKNVPGDVYYRLPTIGIINDQEQGIEKRMEGDGFGWEGETEELLDDEGKGGHFMMVTDILLTNIRVPILWTECYRPGVVIGTAGWDKSICESYRLLGHPAYRIDSIGDSWDEMIYNMMLVSAGLVIDRIDSTDPCIYREVVRVIERDWPDNQQPGRWRRGDTFQGPGLLEYTGHTVDEFLGRTQSSS